MWIKQELSAGAEQQPLGGQVPVLCFQDHSYPPSPSPIALHFPISCYILGK